MREIVWRYHGALYLQLWPAAVISAEIRNANRTKRSDRVWQWDDLHLMHPRKTAGKSGLQIAKYVATWEPMVWLEGFDLNELGA